MSFASWLSSLMQPRRRPIRTSTRRKTPGGRTRSVLCLEELENRIVPANFITVATGGLTTLPVGATQWSDHGTYTIDPSAFANIQFVTLEANKDIHIISDITLESGGGFFATAGHSLIMTAKLTGQANAGEIFLSANDKFADPTQSQVNNELTQLYIGGVGIISSGGVVDVESESGDAATSNIHPSCQILVRGQITSSSDITISGSGWGDGGSGGNAVVQFDGGTVLSTGGNVTVTTGTNIDANSNLPAYGIQIDGGASVQAQGFGSVTMTGTGGPNLAGPGVFIESSSTVSTVNGLLSITGTATSTVANTYGIDLEGGSVVQTTGTGGISLNGSAPAGSTNEGVRIANGSRMTAAGGNASKALGLAAGSTIAVTLDPTRATSTGYQFVNVAGDVSLGGATLEAFSFGTPPNGATYTLITPQNDGSNDGAFNGLAQGNFTTLNDGNTYQINYLGAPGNVVLLTPQQPSRPFYIFGHNPNEVGDLTFQTHYAGGLVQNTSSTATEYANNAEANLYYGANALEPDLYLDPSDNQLHLEHNAGSYKDTLTGINVGNTVYTALGPTLATYLAGLNAIAAHYNGTNPGYNGELTALALVEFDIKTTAATADGSYAAEIVDQLYWGATHWSGETGVQTIHPNDTVLLKRTSANPNAVVYRYVGASAAQLDLTKQNYASDPNWKLSLVPLGLLVQHPGVQVILNAGDSDDAVFFKNLTNLNYANKAQIEWNIDGPPGNESDLAGTIKSGVNGYNEYNTLNAIRNQDTTDNIRPPLGVADGAVGIGGIIPTEGGGIYQALDLATYARTAFGEDNIIPYAFAVTDLGKNFIDTMIDEGIDGLLPGDYSGNFSQGGIDAGIVTTEDTFPNDLEYVRSAVDFRARTDGKIHLATPADDPYAINGAVQTVYVNRDITSYDTTGSRDGYGLQIYTGSYGTSAWSADQAGTDAMLTFTLVGTNGSASITVDTNPTNLMESGSIDHVTIYSKNLGPLISLQVSRDSSGSGPNWTMEKVQISSAAYGAEYVTDNLTHRHTTLNPFHPHNYEPGAIISSAVPTTFSLLAAKDNRAFSPPATKTATSFTSLTSNSITNTAVSSPQQEAGTFISGAISSGVVSLPAGETVVVSAAGVSITTTTRNAGYFQVYLPTSTMQAGTYTVYYSYGGDASFSSATDSSTTLTVTKATAQPTFDVHPNYSVATGTASVLVGGVLSSPNIYFNVPMGETVTISAGGQQSTGVMSASGIFSGTLNTSSLAAGVYPITYTYAGDNNFLGATNSTSTLTVNNHFQAVFSALDSSTSISYGAGSVTLHGVLGNGPNPVPAGETLVVSAGGQIVLAATLSSGFFQATLPTASLAVGSYPIIYSYGGDSTFNSDSDTSTTLTVDKAQPTFSGFIPTTPSVLVGTSSVFLSGVVGAGPSAEVPPGETVTISAGGASITTTTFNTGYFQAFLPTNALAAGAYPITYSYGGDSNFSSVSNTSTTLDVNAGNPTPTFSQLTAAPSVSVSSASVFLSGVLSAGSSAIIPAGETITISAGGQSTTATIIDGDTDGEGTLPNGFFQATLPTAALAVGTYTITYSYGGDTSFHSATNTSTTLTVTSTAVIEGTPQLVLPQPTFSGLTPSQAITVGTGGVTLTGFVKNGSTPVPAGESVIIDAVNAGGTSPGADTMDLTVTTTSNGSFTASLPTNGLAAGTYIISYTYGGDANFNPVTDDSTQLTVNPTGNTPSTFSGLIGSPSVTVGTASVFLYGVISAGPSNPIFGEAVTISAGGHSVAPTTNGRGYFQANLSTTGLAAGSYTITYHIPSDGTFSSATDTSTTLTVSQTNPQPTFSHLTATPSVSYGTASVLLGGLLNNGPLNPVPANETVTISAGGQTVMATTQSDGTFAGELPTTALGAGPYAITYSYSGDSSFTSTSDNSTTLTVEQAQPTFSNLATTASVAQGTATVFLQGVLNAGAAVPVPGGENVTISAGGQTVTTTTLGGGAFRAFLPTAALAGGTYTITYSYGGDSNFSSASDSSTTLTVNQTQKLQPTFSGLIATPNIAAGTASLAVHGTLSAGSSNPVPGGETVTISAGGETVTATTLGGGAFQAFLPTDALAAGSYAISYSYSGDSNFNGANDSSTTLTVSTGNMAPSIATQPTAQTAATGGTATFTAAANGTATLLVQWQVSTDGGSTYTNIAGATSTTLTLSNVTSSQTGYLYQAVFTNAVGSATSNPAALTVSAAAAATVQFSVGSETVNETAGTFSIPVNVTGTVTPTVSTFASGFSGAEGLAKDAAGNLYVANFGAGTVSKVTPAGVVTPFTSGFSNPFGLAFDTAGNLYVANGGGTTVSKVTPGGVITPFATGLSEPIGLAFDSAGNLYVANAGTNTVIKVPAGGGVGSTFATGFNFPVGLAFDAAGNLYVANDGGTGTNANTVSKVTSAGTVTPFASGFSGPGWLTFDSAGNFYVANNNNNTVSKVTSAAVVSTFVPASAGLNGPEGLVFDAAGNLYIANFNGTTMNKVSGPVVPFTLGGTAVSGTDYSGVSASPLVISFGLTTASITGNLVSDPGASKTLTFTLGTPTGASLGSPSVNTLTITEPNLAPTLLSISPTSVNPGVGATTLTATGTNFVNGSTIDFNGTALTTTFVSATQLTATIPAASLTTTGSESITVVTPAPGGGPSNPATLTVAAPLTLALSNQSVPAFHPVGTVVGTLSATESGSGHTFTFSLVSGTGSSGNGSFTISNNQLLSADAFDTATQASYSILVQVTDENNTTITGVFPITITAVPGLSRTGQTLTVAPAAASNFTFTPSATGQGQHLMVLNNVHLAVDVASVNTIHYQGTGTDGVVLNAVGTANTATLGFGAGSLQGSGYTASASAVKVLFINGGGSDSATFTDSSGTNSFYGTVGGTAGAPNLAYFVNSSGQLSKATGFGTVTANTTAKDTAFLYDATGVVADPTAPGVGSHTFTGTPTSSTFSTGGASPVSITVKGYPSVQATSAPGTHDTATLNDITGSNLFVSIATYGYLLVPTGGFNIADNFSTVIGTAAAGTNDAAYMYDGLGGSTFVADPTSATLTSGTVVEKAIHFPLVVAIDLLPIEMVAGSKDTASLTGSSVATNKNSFIGEPTYSHIVTLTSTGAPVSNNFAVDFASVAGFAAAGTNVAMLDGLRGVVNTLVATPAFATLSGGPSGSAYSYTVNGYSSVAATGPGTAADVAYLYGQVAGGDTVVGTPGSSYLSGTGFLNLAQGFGSVQGLSQGPHDLAYLYNDTTGGLFTGQGNTASLNTGGFGISLNSFAQVVAVGAAGGNNKLSLAAITYLFSDIGIWTPV